MAVIANSNAAQDRNAFIFFTPLVFVSIRAIRFRSALCHQHAIRPLRREFNEFTVQAIWDEQLVKMSD
jgi:hypothetical protein